MRDYLTVGDHLYPLVREGENCAYRFGIYSNGVRRFKVTQWPDGRRTVEIASNGEWIEY